MDGWAPVPCTRTRGLCTDTWVQVLTEYIFWYVRDKWMRKVVKRHDRFRRDTCTCMNVRVLLRIQVAVMEGELRRLER